MKKSYGLTNSTKGSTKGASSGIESGLASVSDGKRGNIPEAPKQQRPNAETVNKA